MINNLTRWAKAQHKLNIGRDLILESEGLTWKSFKELEAEAMLEIGDTPVETEYGKVQKIPKGPILWTARRSADVETKPMDSRLKLLKQPEREK